MAATSGVEEFGRASACVMAAATFTTVGATYYTREAHAYSNAEWIYEKVS
jgi:hypothetical protein